METERNTEEINISNSGLPETLEPTTEAVVELLESGISNHLNLLIRMIEQRVSVPGEQTLLLYDLQAMFSACTEALARGHATDFEVRDAPIAIAAHASVIAAASDVLAGPEFAFILSAFLEPLPRRICEAWGQEPALVEVAS